MSTSIFLNFIKLLKNREQIDNKIKRLPYNAYYLTAKHIGGNYRFNEDGNIYYEAVVIDCNSRLGIVVRDKSIIRTTRDKILDAFYNIDGNNPLTGGSYYQGIYFGINLVSKVISLLANICYVCGRIKICVRNLRLERFSYSCMSRRCINACGEKCHQCSTNFHPHDFEKPFRLPKDCVCKRSYIDEEAESNFNLEKLIRHIIALG